MSKPTSIPQQSSAVSRLSSIEMLDRLVAFPSVSRDSNLPLIDWVEDYLGAFSARCRRTTNDAGDKANLFAAIGPDAPGGVVLSGHTDVVPVDDQDWHTDPFKLTEREALRPRHLGHERLFCRVPVSPGRSGHRLDDATSVPGAVLR